MTEHPYSGLIQAYTLGCLSKEEIQNLVNYLEEGNEYDWEQLGEYQNLVALLSSFLDVESPPLQVSQAFEREFEKLIIFEENKQKREAVEPEPVEEEEAEEEDDSLSMKSFLSQTYDSVKDGKVKEDEQVRARSSESQQRSQTGGRPLQTTQLRMRDVQEPQTRDEEIQRIGENILEDDPRDYRLSKEIPPEDLMRDLEDAMRDEEQEHVPEVYPEAGRIMDEETDDDEDEYPGRKYGGSQFPPEEDEYDQQHPERIELEDSRVIAKADEQEEEEPEEEPAATVPAPPKEEQSPGGLLAAIRNSGKLSQVESVDGKQIELSQRNTTLEVKVTGTVTYPVFWIVTLFVIAIIIGFYILLSSQISDTKKETVTARQSVETLTSAEYRFLNFLKSGDPIANSNLSGKEAGNEASGIFYINLNNRSGYLQLVNLHFSDSKKQFQAWVLDGQAYKKIGAPFYAADNITYVPINAIQEFNYPGEKEIIITLETIGAQVFAPNRNEIFLKGKFSN